MKKTILLTFLLFSNWYYLYAQSLRGNCHEDRQGTSSYFTQVDIDATFSFYAKNNSVYIKCSNLKMNVPSNTIYNAYGQHYTKSDLGISQWPQNQKPWSMTINVSGSYRGGNFNKDIFCNVNFTCDEFSIEGIDADKVDLSSFRITSISNFRYNQGGDPQLEEIIKKLNQKKEQQKSTNTNLQNQGSSNNPLGTSQTIPLTSSESNNYAQTTKKEIYTQAAANIAGNLLEEMNTNYEKKRHDLMQNISKRYLMNMI
ncbi:hypothetical protein SGQ44_18125 [Flavobacterium sp. Fl-77]|uniref:Uncharacterized protein n=1 Tax=Flavobacterium flavipigmentatum TaxID=2893884 RepID=A0AAJ2VYY1_9FLAO|nr:MULTISPECIES: hypothetical protein [unclassified Flavobacterium]MDX6184084.1 hypothetical protein [Flavobacterium sp. Fl-33]MDX6187678.1 hypothetical protein [Flavobacterium sp. Fl-77]UFH39196.1 hypothetical protein LNP22_02705 [Flavobacterium sp. F-70]